jgi:hypothetical protein
MGTDGSEAREALAGAAGFLNTQGAVSRWPAVPAVPRRPGRGRQTKDRSRSCRRRVNITSRVRSSSR